MLSFLTGRWAANGVSILLAILCLLLIKYAPHAPESLLWGFLLYVVWWRWRFFKYTGFLVLLWVLGVGFAGALLGILVGLGIQIVFELYGMAGILPFYIWLGLLYWGVGIGFLVGCVLGYLRHRKLMLAQTNSL